MKSETVQILRDMGIDYDTNRLSVPKNIRALNLNIKVKKNGNNILVFCGSMDDYNTLCNAGFKSDYDRFMDCPIPSMAGNTPYLTIAPKRFVRMLKNIAMNRIIVRARELGCRKLHSMHQSLANSYVGLWLAAIPSYDGGFYAASPAASHEAFGYSVGSE